jgi:hypothetical protein
MGTAVIEGAVVAPLRHGEAMRLAETELARMAAQLVP